MHIGRKIKCVNSVKTKKIGFIYYFLNSYILSTIYYARVLKMRRTFISLYVKTKCFIPNTLL